MCTKEQDLRGADWRNFMVCLPCCHPLLSTSLTYCCLWQDAELYGQTWPDAFLFLHKTTLQRELFSISCFTAIIWAVIHVGNKSWCLLTTIFPWGADFEFWTVSSPSNSTSTVESKQGGRRTGHTAENIIHVDKNFSSWHHREDRLRNNFYWHDIAVSAKIHQECICMSHLAIFGH